MKKQKIAAAMLGLSLILSGCGYTAAGDCPDGLDSLKIGKDGDVRYTYRGSFSQDYYEIDGLRELSEVAVKEFNAEYGREVVSLGEVILAEGLADVAQLRLDFTDPKAVEGMTDVYLFYGTLAEAAVSDRSPNNTTLIGAAGSGSTTGLDLIANGSTAHVIMTDLKGAVISPYEPVYLSEGARVVTTEQGTYIDTTNVTADTAVIILKK